MSWLRALGDSLDRALGGPERRRREEARYEAEMRRVSPYYAMQQDHPEYFDRAATDEWWENLSEGQQKFITESRPLGTVPLRASVEHYLSWYRFVDDQGNVNFPQFPGTQQATFADEREEES